jgi:1,2-diacylglycerol 3-alpha-glucosyltransferase
MKIAHLCLSNFYIDGYSYQENELVAQNVADGHTVTVVASTETFGKNQCLTYCKPGSYLGSDGAIVIRVPYSSFLPKVVMKKLRMHRNIYKLLMDLKPDVILFHGTCGWELFAAAQYKRINPNIKFYVDSHEDFNNSARTFISKWILHYFYYKNIIKYNLKWIEKVLCINLAAVDFLHNFYKIPNNILEFFPLGGNIYSDAEYEKQRNDGRDKFQLSEKNVVFSQTGKMDGTKKLVEALRAFTAVMNPHWRFIIAGVVQSDIKSLVEELIANDSRIQYLGWLSSQDLAGLLCAADVYVQPGTQSATMQMSLCCRCVVVIDDVPSHQPFMNDNGWLINEAQSLETIFTEIGLNEAKLPSMSKNSATIASELLDYKKLAARLYH